MFNDLLPFSLSIESETKLRPRTFQKSASMSEERDISFINADIRPGQGVPSSRKNRMINDEDMVSSQRVDNRKFESLKISDKTINSLTIGGYEVNLSDAASKAMDVLPLPPVKLPIIFADDNLNFIHHFFRGIARLIGESVLESIAAKPKYYEDEFPVIYPMIDKLIIKGYSQSDSETTVLVKRVLMSTFELIHKERYYDEPGEVLVVSNIWGFQYVEPGMQMGESDLQMWISICYNQYRNCWFNLFKSSGIPLFATGGVNKSRSSSGNSSSSSGMGTMPMVREVDEMSTVSHMSPSVRTRRKKTKSVRSSNSPPVSNALTHYFART